jgi:hypothetical protein
LELRLEQEPEQGRQEGRQQRGRGGDKTGYQSKYIISLNQEFLGVLRSSILLTARLGGPNQNAAGGGEWRRRQQAF